MKTKAKLIDYLSICSLLVFLIYIVSIFFVNYLGRDLVNYDIYSDAILTKYIATEKTLFPEGWHFGNQVYVIATPVLGAFFYFFVKDSYLSLCLASCVMTLLCVFTYIWAIKPFAKNRSIIISLLIIIGATTVGGTAYGDVNGLQVFYTMASYYSCYIIGIFFTLGVCFRIMNNISVRKIVLLIALFLSFALGIQSLREMLVLNLPLFAISLFILIIYKFSGKELSHQKKNITFVFLTLIANTCGLLFEKLLVFGGKINQRTILKEANGGLIENIKNSVYSFLEYIGLYKPENIHQLFEVFVSLFLIFIIAMASISIIIKCFKKGNISAIEFGVLFFVVSLIAVFCSGIFILKLRPLYYFCWYPLAAFSLCYIVDKECKKANVLKNWAVIVLIFISILNYKPLFYSGLKNISELQNCYRDISEKLLDDDIKYIYSDCTTAKNVISTASFDEITYVTLDFSNNPVDLWTSFDYLYHDSWFDKENFDKAFIVISDKMLEKLDSDYSQEYKEEFLSNLELVYVLDGYDVELYFFRGSAKMFNDMVK